MPVVCPKAGAIACQRSRTCAMVAALAGTDEDNLVAAGSSRPSVAVAATAMLLPPNSATKHSDALTRCIPCIISSLLHLQIGRAKKPRRCGRGFLTRVDESLHRAAGRLGSPVRIGSTEILNAATPSVATGAPTFDHGGRGAS